MLMLLVSNALAGWTVSPEAGTLPAQAKASLDTLIGHCPASQQDWVVRYGDGKLQRLGPVAGASEPDPGLRSCLQAGLESRPVDGVAVLRVSWSDPVAQRWETQVTGILNQVVGPRPAGPCVDLAFAISPQGQLQPPTLLVSSGEPELDQLVLATARSWQQPLPPVPAALREVYGEQVQLCVGGIQK